MKPPNFFGKLETGSFSERLLNVYRIETYTPKAYSVALRVLLLGYQDNENDRGEPVYEKKHIVALLWRKFFH